MEVKAVFVDNIDERRIPGSYSFFTTLGSDEDKGMLYCCPCGCGAIGSLDFKPHPSPSWKWDGNKDKPSLVPSVHHIIDNVSHWHGYLTNGVWKTV